MKKKTIVSLTIAFCFSILGLTGLLMWLGLDQWHPVQTLHVLFGLGFFGFAVFHISNNWKSITSYAKPPQKKALSKEVKIVFVGFAILFIGGILELPPFVALAYKIRAAISTPPPGEMQPFDEKHETEEVRATFNAYISETLANKTIENDVLFATNDALLLVQNGTSFSPAKATATLYQHSAASTFDTAEVKIHTSPYYAITSFKWITTDSLNNLRSFGSENQVLIKEDNTWKIQQINRHLSR